MAIASFPAGTSFTLPLQINQADGVTPSGAYLPSDGLSTVLWPGDTQAAAAAPATAWTACPAFAVSFAGPDTAGFTAGIYRFAVSVTRGAQTVEVYRDSIELLAEPTQAISNQAVVIANLTAQTITSLTIVSGGSGYPKSSTTIPVTITGGGGYGAIVQATSNAAGSIVALTILNGGYVYTMTPTVTVGPVKQAVYCSLNDMQTECAWIGQYIDESQDQTGFLEQRAKARLWMDGLILYGAPIGGPGALISRQTWWSWAYSGVDPRSGTGLAIDQVLKSYLDTGGLIVAGPQGARIVTACACYSIALVLRAQIGLSPEQSKYAGYFMRRAHSEASMARAEVCIDGTGRPAYVINLGSTNTRYG